MRSVCIVVKTKNELENYLNHALMFRDQKFRLKLKHIKAKCVQSFPSGRRERCCVDYASLVLLCYSFFFTRQLTTAFSFNNKQHEACAENDDDDTLITDETRNINKIYIRLAHSEYIVSGCECVCEVGFFGMSKKQQKKEMW